MRLPWAFVTSKLTDVILFELSFFITFNFIIFIGSDKVKFKDLLKTGYRNVKIAFQYFFFLFIT